MRMRLVGGTSFAIWVIASRVAKQGRHHAKRAHSGKDEQDSMHILITGGAGFIVSHLADDLIARGHRVRALDNLAPQVHGDVGRPSYLHADVELLKGDVRD